MGDCANGRASACSSSLLARACVALIVIGRLGLSYDVYYRHDPDRGLGDVNITDYESLSTLDAIVDDYFTQMKNRTER